MEALDDHLDPETVDRPLVLIATGLVVGGIAELALHTWIVSGEPAGLGIPLAAAVVVAGLLTGARRLGRSPDPTTTAIYLAAVGFAVLTAVRASTPIVVINLISSLFLIGLATTTHNPAAVRPVFVSGFLRAVNRAVAAASFGGFLIGGRDVRELDLPSAGKLRRIAVGAFMALPLLIVLGALFMSADQVFGDAIRSMLSIRIPDQSAVGFAIAALIAWTTMGLLRGAVVTPAPVPDPSPRHLIGTTETSTTMWLLNGLFALFVAFQVFEAAASYQSQDVSYAHQARNGFFQLVWVAAFVVMVVLILDWLVHKDGHRRLHRQQAVLVALTGAILVSAVVRMGLYVEAYGLTRLRVFTTVFMLWIAFMLVWLTRTVLAGRRDRFARPVVAGLLGAVLLLNVINPDGLIASYNLDHEPRLVAGVDRSYLYSSLSPDAVPAIVDNLDVFGGPCDQLAVLERLPVTSSSDIRSWNLSRTTAARLVSALRDELADKCQPG
ncbi:MAG: DUF4173 domain-containing protein [bacterium]|nr:DUF4173 domain-containing protein [bacterium]